MAIYNMIPNSHYSAANLFQNNDLQKVEKIVWCKNVGDYLNPGDILCLIHYNDYVLEMECTKSNYLLYKNTQEEVSFSSILSISGDLQESIEPILKKHQQDIKDFNVINTPLFIQKFQIENYFVECSGRIID